MDAEDAIEAEAYAALSVPGVTDIAEVFQHVPQDKKLEDPGDAIVIIGDMSGEAIETKDSTDHQGEIVIVGIIVAEERKPIRVLKKAVLDALNGHDATRDGWRLVFTFADAEAFLDPETGQAYVGNFRFRWIAMHDDRAPRLIAEDDGLLLQEDGSAILQE